MLRPHVTLVIGAPCSGKTTYVREHMQPGDLVVDYDALAVALGSPDDHDHPASLKPYIMQARDAVLARTTRDPHLPRAWLIKCDPVQADYAIASQVVRLDTDRDECKRRAHEAGRPTAWVDHIDRWFDAHHRATTGARRG